MSEDDKKKHTAARLKRGWSLGLSRQFPFIRGRQVTSGQQARSPARICDSPENISRIERGNDEARQSEKDGRRGDRGQQNDEWDKARRLT